MKKSLLVGCLIAASIFTGCATGGSSTPTVNGAAAGGNTTGSTNVERCSKLLGTVAFEEDQRSDWYAYLTRNYKLGSTLPVIRMLTM